jgi:hypothetical protein
LRHAQASAKSPASQSSVGLAVGLCRQTFARVSMLLHNGHAQPRAAARLQLGRTRAQRKRRSLSRAGVVECVGVAIMVGLAVDYVVHVSSAVAHCGEAGRRAVEAALRTVGLSVVSGAATTIGAALFLLPCEIAVFQQFGAATLGAAPLCAGSCTRAEFASSHLRPKKIIEQSACLDARKALATVAERAAGTMVVITLSTALVFALVVFPAASLVLAPRSPDTGALRALAAGRFAAFMGCSSGASVPRPWRAVAHDGSRSATLTPVRQDSGLSCAAGTGL